MSSSVRRFAYEGTTAELEIEFVRGGTYRYFMVPRRIFEEMQRSNSIGTYVNEKVVGTFVCKRIR